MAQPVRQDKESKPAQGKRESLKVDKRTVTGKKVKKLRREGILPANVYGKAFKSTSVQVPVKDFLAVYKNVHETGLVDIAIDSQTIPVLIHNVQIDPQTQNPLHADFYKVDLKEKVTAKVPVVAVGEAKAVADKIGLLEQPVLEVEVEALPGDLPEKIEINVENLAQIDDQITIGDAKAPEGVTILADSSQVVFKIGELVAKAVEEEVAAQEAAAVEAAAEAATAEGEAPPAEGEAPAEPAPSGEAPAEGVAKGEPKEAKSEEKPAETPQTNSQPIDKLTN